jgi:hypothetical protein
MREELNEVELVVELWLMIFSEVWAWEQKWDVSHEEEKMREGNLNLLKLINLKGWIKVLFV